VRVASDTNEDVHRDHVVCSRCKPIFSESRAGRVGCQVGGSFGVATRREAPLSDMARIGLLAMSFSIIGIGARSMSEVAEFSSPEGGRVTCHACRSLVDGERAMRVESWYQRHVSIGWGIDVGISGHLCLPERGMGQMCASQEGSGGIVAISDPVWFREIEIGAWCGSGLAGVFVGGMSFWGFGVVGAVRLPLLFWGVSLSGGG